MNNTRLNFTGHIRAKGWKLKDALKYWGRSNDWYQRNCDGEIAAKNRLQCMIDGLPVKESV